MAAPARSTTLVERHDSQVSAPLRRTARVRLAVAGGEAFDAILEHDTARLEPLADGADALLTADRTWAAIARDLRGGMTGSSPRPAA